MTNTTNPFEGSDRYQYQVDHTEGSKTFKAGSVARMSAGDAAPLIAQGVLKQVAAFTLCRVNPLADGGCAPLPSEFLIDGLPEAATATAGNRITITNKNKH